MRSSCRNRSGFTLVELMFSMAIGSLILILAASMLGSSGDGYERVGGSVATEREARALITQLSSDLATARFHEDGFFDQSSSSWPVDRLGFLSLQPAQAQSDDGRIGDLCAVNYYIADLPIGGRLLRCLMRGFRESDNTFTALRNGGVEALFDAQPQVDEPVAFGVVSFEARPMSLAEDGAWIDWAESDTTPPDALEVKLVVARRNLWGRLKTAQDWDGSSALGNPGEADRSEDLEVYESTIRFGNHAKL